MRVLKLLTGVILMALLTGCGTKDVAKNDVAQNDVAQNKEVKEESTEAVPEVEIDNSLISAYNIFEVHSDNLNDGKWDDVVSYTNKGENKSPQLSWDPVEGATTYVVYMVDTSMQYWIHWKAQDIQDTDLPLGYSSETEYIGPYPPAGGSHTYEVYVIALKKPAERVKGGLNGQNAKFESFIEFLDTDADGNTGNIAGAAHISGTFTN